MLLILLLIMIIINMYYIIVAYISVELIMYNINLKPERAVQLHLTCEEHIYSPGIAGSCTGCYSRTCTVWAGRGCNRRHPPSAQKGPHCALCWSLQSLEPAWNGSLKHQTMGQNDLTKSIRFKFYTIYKIGNYRLFFFPNQLKRIPSKLFSHLKK